MLMENVESDWPCAPLGLGLRIELARDDERWIADVVDLPGVMVYGSTRGEAFCTAQALALEVLADRLKQGEDLLTGQPSEGPRPALGDVVFSAA